MATTPATPTIVNPGSPTAVIYPSQNCITATPDANGYVPPDSCNALYSFYPNFAVNVSFAVLFFLTFTTHMIQMFVYKKRFTWVVCMGAAWEVMAFALRSAGALDQQNLQYAIWGTLFLLLAPLWVNAFVYMTLARLVYFLLPDQKTAGMKAIWLTKIFVWLDIVSFVVQVAGGSMLSVNDEEGGPNIAKIGQQVYTAGTALQGFFILLFGGVAWRFHRRVRALARENSLLLENKMVERLAWTLYVVLAMILLRIIYRIVEFTGGVGDSNELIRHEYFAFVLDGTPMLIAITLLNIRHPGMVLRGPGSEFKSMSRKEKKSIKTEKKKAKRQSREVRKAEKTARKQGMKTAKALSHEGQEIAERDMS